MKARVKATGEIMEFSEIIHLSNDDKETKFEPEDLEFLDSPKDEPDYWERLKHQYAGMAMQGYIIAAHLSQFSFCEDNMNDCVSMATALVEKLKEEEK